jgi:hypothetical protein
MARPQPASRRPSPIVGLEYKHPRYPLDVPVEVWFTGSEDYIPGIIQRYTSSTESTCQLSSAHTYHFHYTHPVTNKKACREVDSTCRVRIDGKEWKIYKTSVLVNDDWMVQED